MEEVQRQPPAEAVPVTDDGLVKKIVLQEGTGALPPKHARCLVHFVGRLAETGEVFMNTREESESQEPETLVAGRDSSYQEVGLNLAAATMRCGEKARLWVPPEYGYGERGSFSFPTVPPNADLVYDIELLEFEPPEEDKEQEMMTFEERLEAAERRRLEGNELFKEDKFKEALSRYRLALSYLNADLMMQLTEYHFDKATSVRRPLMLNLAAAALRVEDYEECITACSEVLSEDKQNAKALFRRGRARFLLGQSEGALKDLEAAQAAAPHDGGIARELAAVRKAIKEERQASEKVFKAYFSQAQKQARQPLYEDPPHPLTPEGSASEVLGQHTLKQLAAPLHRHGWVRWAALAAATAAAVAWCWPSAQRLVLGDA